MRIVPDEIRSISRCKHSAYRNVVKKEKTLYNQDLVRYKTWSGLSLVQNETFVERKFDIIERNDPRKRTADATVSFAHSSRKVS